MCFVELFHTAMAFIEVFWGHINNDEKSNKVESFFFILGGKMGKRPP